MLSCFPFSYQTLEEDDYSCIFLEGNQQLTEANTSDISLNFLDTSSRSKEKSDRDRVKLDDLEDKLPLIDKSSPSFAAISSSSSIILSSCSSINSDITGFRFSLNKPNEKVVDSLSNSFNKPKDGLLNANTFNLITIDNSSLTSTTIGSKASRLRFSFGRSKGTEHLQEALRKSSENSCKNIASQRYIKLPSNSSRFVNKPKSVEPKCDSQKLNSVESSATCSPISKPKLNTSFDLDKHISNTQCSERSLSNQPPPRPTTSHPGLTNMSKPKSWTSSSNLENIKNEEKNLLNTSIYPAPDDSLANQVTSLSILSSSVNENETLPISNNTNLTNLASSSLMASSSTLLDTNTLEIARSNTNFINKPLRGWLHSDQKIAETGICYSVRYVGCLEINTSMKSLEFETRSKIAKECINRVCEAGGLKTVDKKRRVDRNICKMLSDRPNMHNAGSNVNLTITSSYLNLTVMETGEIIAKHEMPNISFASGGDADTLDFVAYVAKDNRFSRACFVLECGGGSAQDVITTIGQAFELRFKEFLKRKPKSLNESLQNRFESKSLSLNGMVNQSNVNQVLGGAIGGDGGGGGSGGEDRDYYNDLPGKMPPDIPEKDTDSQRGKETFESLRSQPQIAHSSCLKKCLPNRSTVDHSQNLIDLTSDIQTSLTTSESNFLARTNFNPTCSSSTFPRKAKPDYVNCYTDEHSTKYSTNNRLNENAVTNIKDPFDMQPFDSTLESVNRSCILDSSTSSLPNNLATLTQSQLLAKEEWFHGSISRKESEALVVYDGDFLVRESQGLPGQFVLTGMQGGVRKHLLLVDPEGVVRTKDKTFESVGHLITYHRDNGLPIISAESALVLRNPVKHSL